MNRFEVSLILAALVDPAEVQSRRVKVSPACALLLDLIVEEPVACRSSLEVFARLMLNPLWIEHGSEAVDLAAAVEKRLAWLADSRAGVA